MTLNIAGFFHGVKSERKRRKKSENYPLKGRKLKTDCFDLQNRLFWLSKQSVFKNLIS
jgi:hypothetical protein